MTNVHTWNTADIGHEHERKAARDIIAQLKALPLRNPIHVCFGLKVPGAEIDCVALGASGALIMEMKEWRYRVFGSLNHPCWQRFGPGGSLYDLPGDQNPYQQVLKQRSKLARELRSYGQRRQVESLDDNRLSDFIRAGLLQCPRLDAELHVEGIPWWFATGLDQVGKHVDEWCAASPRFDPAVFASFLARLGCRRDGLEVEADSKNAIVLQPSPPTAPPTVAVAASVVQSTPATPDPSERGTSRRGHRQRAVDTVVYERAKAELAVVQETPHDAHLLVTAGPGSGKTQFLVGRALHLLQHVSPTPRVAVVTFTNAARDNVDERLGRLAGERARVLLRHTWVGTLHQLAVHLLRSSTNAWARLRVVAQEVERRQLARLLRGRPTLDETDDPSIDAFLEAIAKWPGTGPNAPDPRLASAWEAEMRHRQEASFHGLLWCAIRDLAPFDTALLPQFLLIDECQDLCALQLRFVEALVHRGVVVQAVGDPEQAIFGFAGAVGTAMHELGRSLTQPRRASLTFNHRSQPTLVAFATPLRHDGLRQQAVRLGTAIIHEHRFASPRAEARRLAQHIKTLADPESNDSRYSYRQIAILVRESHATELLRSLRGEGIPVRESFASRPLPLVLRQFVAVAEAARAPDLDALADHAGAAPHALAMTLVVHHGARAHREVTAHLAALTPLASTETMRTALRAMHKFATRTLTGGAALGAACDDLYRDAVLPFTSSLQRMSCVGEDVDRATLRRLAEHATDVDTLLQRMSQGDAVVVDPDLDLVTVTTIHRAKGHEWPVVFLPTLTDGVLPHRRATDIDEERRLLYVGITRAIDEAHLSWVDHALHRGRGRSRLLDSLKLPPP